ncbi:MAG: sporulation protein YunB [Clostridiales bacterium]|nr:sporulation protein YunB [Clostridiales bacterium]
MEKGKKEKKKLGKLRKILRMTAIIFLILSAIFLLLEKNLEAVILDLAHARAEAMAVEYIHQAIQDVMGQGVVYGEMMQVQTDAEGRVTMLQANAVRMNELATATALRAQEKLESAESQSVEIPLGAALGVPFLSALGPKVPVKIIPVSAVNANFSTEFESAGINQTRHKIFLSLLVSVRLVIPSGARQVSIAGQALIAEAIIVGQVPQSYVQVPEYDDALNFAIP